MLNKIAAALEVGPDALFHEPLPDLVERAVNSTAPRRTRKPRAAEAESGKETPPAESETNPEPAESVTEPTAGISANASVVAEQVSSAPETPASEEDVPEAAEAPAESAPAPADVPAEETESAEEPAPAPVVTEECPATDDVVAETVAAEPEEEASEEQAESEDDEPLPPPVFPAFPGPQEALSAFGERLAGYLEHHGITPENLGAFAGEMNAARIRAFILGATVPDIIDLRIFAGIFEVTVNRLRCEVVLPSATTRACGDFVHAALASGLCLIDEVVPVPEEAAPKESTPEPEEELPEAVPEPEPDPCTDAEGNAKIGLGGFISGDAAPLPTIISCEAKTGLLADLIRNKSVSLYTVPGKTSRRSFRRAMPPWWTCPVLPVHLNSPAVRSVFRDGIWSISAACRSSNTSLLNGTGSSRADPKERANRLSASACTVRFSPASP